MEEKKIKKALRKGPKTSRELDQELKLKGDPALGKLLRKMKRAGDIKTKGNRWYDASFSVCPHCEGKGWVQN
jgi:hypothetical protein